MVFLKGGRFGHRTLPQGEALNGRVAEEAVHPFDDLRLHVGEMERKGAIHLDGQGAAPALARRKAELDRQAVAGELRSDDLSPARDDGRLREALTPDDLVCHQRGEV